jgi:hypothetical protein
MSRNATMRSALLEKFNSNMLSVLSTGKTGNGTQKFSGIRDGFVRNLWQPLYLPPVPAFPALAT